MEEIKKEKIVQFTSKDSRDRPIVVIREVY